MRVDERWCEHEAVRIDHRVRIGIEVGAEGGDHSVVHANVDRSVHTLPRIENACAARDEALAGRVPAKQHHATSTGSPTGTGAGAPTSRS